MTTSSNNNAIQLRREMEMSLQYTNRVGFKLLEFGAETKYTTERILIDIVETVTTNPLEWDSVKHHMARIEFALKKIATYFQFKSRIKKQMEEEGGENTEKYPTYSKIQYLEEELLRLQEEMKRMKEISSEPTDETTTEEDVPECTTTTPDDSLPESIDEQNRIPFEVQPIPFPPALPPVPIYIKQKKTENDLKNVYTRRLPPTNSLSSAIKLGAAIKLRKVDVPRSPGGTPTRVSGREERSKSGSSSSTIDMLSLALEEKFKNIKSPPSSPVNDDFTDDPRVIASYEPKTLLTAINTVKLRKTTSKKGKKKQAEKALPPPDPLMEALRKRREKIKGQEVVSDNFTAQKQQVPEAPEVPSNQDEVSENFERQEKELIESREETNEMMDPLECALQNFQASRVMDDVVTELSVEDEVDPLESALEKYKTAGRVIDDVSSCTDTEENYVDAYEEYSKSVVFKTDSTVPTGTMFSTPNTETYMSGMKVKAADLKQPSRDPEALRIVEIDSDCAESLSDLQMAIEKLEGETQ